MSFNILEIWNNMGCNVVWNTQNYMLGKCCTPVQISWTETCDCPARKMSAPLLDIVKAADTKLQETKPQDLKARDSKSKDDNAEKENASNLESDRFDTQNLLSAFSGCNLWDSFS